MSYTTIRFAVADGVAALTLNRPEHRNRCNAHMLEELRDVLKHLHTREDTRVLLLKGEGRDFCAGHDLGPHQAVTGSEVPDLGAALDRGYNPLLRALHGLPVPVLCAVQGSAAGAGACLALACDIVIAARSARFVLDGCRFGLIPDAGGTWFLPRQIGLARATALAMLGEAVEAPLAWQWGMIWQCVDDAALDGAAQQLARRLAVQPTRTLGFIKHALHQSLLKPLDDQLDVERDYQRLAGRTADFREGLAAWQEQREPVFKGH
ncbi:MAG: enoyl-CoA hydratase-related protein [Pseudomonadota bacterium]|nr:enoyl-CoA hydratase-related protein [Pseudomonadota bacterium]